MIEYQILSDLIYKGFLLIGLKLGNSNFVFKTINEREYKLIKLYTGLETEKSYVNRFNINYLIFSLFLLNGENILLQREEKYKDLFKFFFNMPLYFCNRILEELTALRETALSSSDCIEGFSYTDRSRRIWKHTFNGFPNRVEFTGIPGTSKMGLNIFQENWILINKMLDDESQYNSDFSRSLFVASASNPKGVRSVRTKFESNLELTAKRREKLAKLGSIKKQEWTPEKWSAPVDTAEELVAELMRQMEGKKDKHDKFIDQHMERLKKRSEEKALRAEKRLEEIRKRRDISDIPITVEQRPLSPEESEKLMKRSKKSNNLVIISSEGESENAQKRVISKINRKVLRARK